MKLITTQQLIETYGKDKLLDGSSIEFVDIRGQDEYQHEHITAAVNIPLAQLSSLTPNEHSHKIAIFYCRSGNRTQINEALIDSTPYKEKYCLEGGIVEWGKANLPTTKQTHAPIDVMRQVQLIVSIMILLGVILNYTVSPYFIILTVIAGIGLFIAGSTGFCGMANLLKYMPWNKP